MNDKSAAAVQIQALKQRLETAMKSRSTLEDDYKTNSEMLITFISKLSQACKGVNFELDNRLAKFRVLITKSGPIPEIQQEINIISKILEQHSLTNDHQIREMHEQFLSAGKTLQKHSGLPQQLRRELRTLLKDTEESKDTLSQYLSPFNQLLAFYNTTLKAKNGLITDGPLLNPNKPSQIDLSVLRQFSNLLNQLELSNKYHKKLALIKKSLSDNITNEKLLQSFLDTLHVLISDFNEEKQISKSFLFTLSKTLSTVQTTVKTTLTNCQDSQQKHSDLNNQLQNQIAEMTGIVESATLLSKIKIDINEKIHFIASTLKQKTNFEDDQSNVLKTQLNDMTKKVSALQIQSQSFEKRLQEQQIKSMLDALTKLNNRAAYDEHFAKEMVRYHHKKFKLALVIIDLDDFKRINDTYGHTAGDKTLQVIAKTLKTQLPKEAFISRYGGEEFVIIFSGINKKDLINKLNVLREYIARLPFKFKNTKVSITTSIGVSHIKPDDNVHTAFERADTALYQAKEQGKNKVVYLL